MTLASNCSIVNVTGGTAVDKTGPRSRKMFSMANIIFISHDNLGQDRSRKMRVNLLPARHI